MVIRSIPPHASSSEHHGGDRRPVRPGRATAPALRRGLDILELFLDRSDALRVPEITEALGIPRASVHELVGALVERGYLRPAPASSSRYVLGVKAFELGGAYERGFDLVASGRAAARRIAAECGETAQMVIRDGRHVIYVAKVDSTHSIRMVSHVGGRLPTWCTAVGKVMLASLPPEELDALFPDDSALIPMTARSITTKRRLLQELEITRARGWGRESGESNDDVTCVAAPVYDRRGACVAAISISVPNMRWDAAGEPKYAELIVRGAEELSRDLGWLRTPDADASSSGESDPASR